jgi:lactam utilization protein B
VVGAIDKTPGPDMGVDPGYPDKAGFGRRVLVMSPEEAYAEM